MTPSALTDRFIEASIRELDYFRCSPARIGGEATHKEWQHFIVHADGVQLLINFNLLDDRWATAVADREVRRVIALARVEGRWIGGIDRFNADDVVVRPGHIGARFGPNTLSFEDGRYHVRVALTDGTLAADLVFEPATVPMLANNQPLSRDRMVSWMFVPRLACSGTATLGSETYRIDAAVAYHDHNWGNFAWGEDFAWEWGSALGDTVRCPWSMVYARMSDLGRNVARGQGLFVWRGAHFYRLFRDDEIELRSVGRLCRPSPLKLPPVMGLLSPGGAHDLPARFEISARGGDDHVHVVFEAEDVVQIIIPNDSDVDGVTVLNEVTGRVSARGRARGLAVTMDGPGVFEFIRS
jgi:hypothetical protein